MRARFLAHLLLAVAAIAGLAAAAAVTTTLASEETPHVFTADPPVAFHAGDDAGPTALSDHVTAYHIAGNRSSFTATVRGVPEATLTIGSFFKLVNTDDVEHAVTFTTERVTHAHVTAYAIVLRDAADGRDIATLDFTSASPAASFTIPVRSTFHGALHLALAGGAGADNVALENALTVRVT